MTSQHYINNLWRWKCGLPELQPNSTSKLQLQSLKQTEWSQQFEQLMRNRLIMGAMRYGKMNDKCKSNYDRVDSMISRLIHFSETGNKELLVDVANLAMVEFVETRHPKAHFNSIDDGIHVRRVNK